MRCKILCLVCAVEALVPSSRLRRPLTSLEVSYLSEVEENGKEKRTGEQPSDPRAHSGAGQADSNAGPTSYEGFVDAEGFDGGDGQVGVVGDGKISNLEEFDKTQAVDVTSQRRIDNAVGGSESKQTQKNVWGFSTGYAEDLKSRGMVDIDEYGEDRLKARRQQLENFRNQAEVRAQKEGAIRDLASLQGKEHMPARQGSYLDQFESKTASASLQTAPVHREASPDAAGGLAAGDVLHGELTFTAGLNGRDGETLSINNEYSTYSDFVAGFTPGSSPCFSVEPNEGTLNRRGGEPQEFVVKFEPSTYAEAFQGTLVIKSEDYTWTYNCNGKLN